MIASAARYVEPVPYPGYLGARRLCDGRARSVTPTVTVYGKPECHLCDDALTTLRRLRAGTPFELVEVDITADDALHARYLERIPVIALDGDDLYDYFVDEADLLRRLARVADGP